jgi:hypothetical protein
MNFPTTLRDFWLKYNSSMLPLCSSNHQRLYLSCKRLNPIKLPVALISSLHLCFQIKTRPVWMPGLYYTILRRETHAECKVTYFEISQMKAIISNMLTVSCCGRVLHFGLSACFRCCWISSKRWNINHFSKSLLILSTPKCRLRSS